VIRHAGTTVREWIRPTTPLERALYSEASAGPDGARIRLFAIRPPSPARHLVDLHLRRSVEVAALQQLLHALRVALEREEQRGLLGENTEAP